MDLTAFDDIQAVIRRYYLTGAETRRLCRRGDHLLGVHADSLGKQWQRTHEGGVIEQHAQPAVPAAVEDEVAQRVDAHAQQAHGGRGAPGCSYRSVVEQDIHPDQ